MRLLVTDRLASPFPFLTVSVSVSTYLFLIFLCIAAPESSRAISTARLNPSQGLHLPPIHVVVFNDPQARSYLAAGFALRCFQRLSLPDAATRRCPWRDSRHTGGLSITVLSY